jgi:hypothetical protein
MAEEELKPIPSKGWAAMIRKVNPMVCPKCGGLMKVVAFITEYAVVDRIIDHLKLKFIAEKPPPSRVFAQVALMAADSLAEYFLLTAGFDGAQAAIIFRDLIESSGTMIWLAGLFRRCFCDSSS